MSAIRARAAKIEQLQRGRKPNDSLSAKTHPIPSGLGRIAASRPSAYEALCETAHYALSTRFQIIDTGALTIARPPRRSMAPPVKSGPRFNEMINVDKVRVIDESGENIGVMYTKEAIEQAAEAGLDLVEVSPGADPPVCKFLDVGKYRYEAQKKANAARKTQKTQDIKEVKMRPNIDVHDYDVKMRNVNKFIDDGDKVKITLRFRGREMAHQELGMNLLKRVQDDVAEVAKVEAFPRLEGRQMLMVLSPK